MLTNISLSPFPQWNAAAFDRHLILVEFSSFKVNNLGIIPGNAAEIMSFSEGLLNLACKAKPRANS